MADLKCFLHGEGNPYPALVKAALAHVQCETIHPFLDGNGRIRRLLIAFLLHHDGLLSQPLLYLSLYRNLGCDSRPQRLAVQSNPDVGRLGAKHGGS